jgi:flagellum-specific ATP synthase
MNDPVGDASRAALDGHIILSRDLANHNHYPAVDVLQSISRLMKDIIGDEQRAMSEKVLDFMATYKRYEDVINIGAYKEGANPKLDLAIRVMEKLNPFLRQNISEKVTYAEGLRQLRAILKGAE